MYSGVISRYWIKLHPGSKCFPRVALIFVMWTACDWNLVMMSSLASKYQDFKLRGLQFHFIKRLKTGIQNWIIFDTENWLWKSEIGIFWSLDLERMLIWQKTFLWKSAIFHSIKLPFDAEVDEKFLNVIYLLFISQESNIDKLVEWQPSLFYPALWNIGILLHKQPTAGKHFEPECMYIKLF